MPLSPILILKSTIDNYLKSSVDFFDGFIADLGFSGDFIPHDVCFLFNMRWLKMLDSELKTNNYELKTNFPWEIFGNSGNLV